MKVEGINRLLTRLSKMRAKEKDPTPSVIVGYTANYALYVHESIEMKLKGQPRSKPSKGRYWDPQGRGQAKFLEKPAREMKNEIHRIVAAIVKRGGTLTQGLLAAGMRLQRESQKIVPVDTGNLKNSAFTRKE